MSNISNVTKQLNQLQADSHALFIKFHDYHWNIKGLYFFSIHARTEEAYNQMATLFDDLAERALQVGGKAITCQKQLLELAKSPKISQESYSARDVVGTMCDAYNYLKAEFLILRKYADEVDDFTTVALAEDNIAKLEQAIWMLNNALDSAEPSAK